METPSSAHDSKRSPFKVSTRYADSRVTHQSFSKDGIPQGFNYDETVEKLSGFYRQVKRQILRYQSPTTGLFPADLGHDTPTEAHIRDSLYCCYAVWALAQAFKRIDDDRGKTYELSQSAVKCMCGILACWMKQADKVEKFKKSQSPKNALHSKFHMVTGEPLTKDDEYEHLQIDCVALYMIFLVQMIQSGLQIIFTTDEVNFVQNLVFYMERAYRTPDFGMWERGSKYNNGSSELHASSIGMTKAALEAINGTNMFGETGANWSVIFIDVDAHYRNRVTFDTLLPRESASKNTDASLLPTISWPAFAIHEESLVHRTKDKVLRKLRGEHGLKRFLRDGYKTQLEDPNRKYYKPSEVKTFDGIECEWPMFYAYLIIDSVYRGDHEQVGYWQAQLKPLLRPSPDGPVIPKYYYLPKESIDLERQNPGSQRKYPSTKGSDTEGGDIFLWGQSVYIISQLLVSGLININELDPIRRYLPAAERPRPNTRYSSFQRGSTEQSSPSDLVIQVVLISESVRLQQMLATYGIQTQTPHQIEPIQIWPPGELTRAYEQLGVNHKLGLSGRPPRPIGGLGTAKIYRACGYTFLCYPLLFEVNDFYLSQDMQFVIDDVKNDLVFLGKCWKLAGRPTFCMLIREDNLRGPKARLIFDLLAEFKRGECDKVKVRLGRLQEFISSACIEHLDFMNADPGDKSMFKPFQELEKMRRFKSLTDIPKMMAEVDLETWINYQDLQHKSTWDITQMLLSSESMCCQAQCLQLLLNREGLYHRVESCTVEEKLEALLHKASRMQRWAVVRFTASLLNKVVDSLAPSITAVLVRGKQITIGVYGHEEEVIDKPVSPSEIKTILFSKCFPYDVIQAVLQQELIINTGKFITSHPEYFSGILKIRIGWMIQAMQLELNYTNQAESSLNVLSPSALKKLFKKVLQKGGAGLEHRSEIWSRQLDGALNRVPIDFYDKVWSILERTPAGIKVAGYHLPQQPTLSDMTQYELNFSLLVEQMLSKIVDPAYRQIIVETFMVVWTILDRNPELFFQGPVELDKLVHHAFETFQSDQSRLQEKEKRDDMNEFYNTTPNIQRGTTSYIAKAVLNTLLDGQVRLLDDISCCIS